MNTLAALIPNPSRERLRLAVQVLVPHGHLPLSSIECFRRQIQAESLRRWQTKDPSSGISRAVNSAIMPSSTRATFRAISMSTIPTSTIPTSRPVLKPSASFRIPNKDVVDRQGLVSSLDKLLLPSRAFSSCSAALWGLGGSGYVCTLGQTQLKKC